MTLALAAPGIVALAIHEAMGRRLIQQRLGKLKRREVQPFLSALAATALGLPQDTVSASVGEAAGTNARGSHLIMYQNAIDVAPGRFKKKIRQAQLDEIRGAAEGGIQNFNITLRVLDRLGKLTPTERKHIAFSRRLAIREERRRILLERRQIRA